MAAKTLEDKLDEELEMIEISVKSIRLGIDKASPRRLEWIESLAGNAREIQARIEKRDARQARKVEVCQDPACEQVGADLVDGLCPTVAV